MNEVKKPGKRVSEAPGAMPMREENFRAVANLVPDLLWRLDPEGAVDWINQRWIQYTGQSAESAAGDGWLATIHPDDLEKVKSELKTALATGLPMRIEQRIRSAAGEYRWFLVRKDPLREGDQVVRWFAAATDVHEQRVAAEALRASEERFRQFADNSSDVFWILDAETSRLEYVNPVYEKIFGRPRSEILHDRKTRLEVIHPDDREAAVAGIDDARAGKTFVRHYRVLSPPEGKIRWIRDMVFPIRNDAGEVMRIAGVAQDVTEEREFTERLGISEERFQLAARATRDIIWDIDLINDRVLWSEALQTRFGYAPKQIGHDSAWWFDHVHPDDRQRARASMEKAIRGEEDIWREEFRFQRADGSYAHIADRGFIIRDEKGRALRMIGAFQDVTEREESHAILRESEERFRLLVEGAREYAIFIIDPSNTISHWYKGAERVFGWTAEEAVGRSGRLIFTPEDLQVRQEEKEISIAMREGNASDRRWHLRKDGSRIWVDGVMHRLNDEKTGALRGFAKIARDATAEHIAQKNWSDESASGPPRSPRPTKNSRPRSNDAPACSRNSS